MEKVKTNSRILLIITAVLAVLLVGLLIWAVILMNQSPEASGSADKNKDPGTASSQTGGNGKETEDTQGGADDETDPTPSQSGTTEPSTNVTEPSTGATTGTTGTTAKPSTKPNQSTDPSEPEKTPERLAAEAEISAYAAQFGYTLADYPEKIIDLYARKPETKEFVLNFPLEYGKDHAIDISGHANDEGVPLFIQWDKQWGYLDYTGNVAGLSACGPTCMSMIMYHFTRDPQYTPAYMMEFALNNPRYAVKGSGTQWAFFKEGGKELGLSVKELNSDQIASEKAIARVLSEGRVIVMNVKPGVFTTIGHYLLIVGYEDGKFRVNDPNSPSNSEKLWDFSEFSDQVKMMWSFGPGDNM